MNDSSPFSGTSVLNVTDLDERPVSIAWAGRGFAVECGDCLGITWRLFDLTGREVRHGRIQSFNGLTVPAGSYVLSLPTVGHHEVLTVQY